MKNKDKEIKKLVEMVMAVIRRGWLKRNIANPKNDADHSFGVFWLVLCYCPSSLNLLKCLKMALTHDLCEAISGDDTPGERSEEEKYTRELSAIQEIAAMLDMPEIVDLFIEFAENKTPESHFVNGMDKLEAVYQANYYASEGHCKREVFYEFWENALQNPKTQTPIVRELLENIQNPNGSFDTAVIGIFKEKPYNKTNNFTGYVTSAWFAALLYIYCTCPPELDLEECFKLSNKEYAEGKEKTEEYKFLMSAYELNFMK